MRQSGPQQQQVSAGLRDLRAQAQRLYGDEASIASYNAAVLRSIPNVCTLWLPGHCGRFGLLAEETLVLFGWESSQDLAFGFPPQV